MYIKNTFWCKKLLKNIIIYNNNSMSTRKLYSRSIRSFLPKEKLLLKSNLIKNNDLQ